MVRFIVACRHIIDTLFDNPEALTHFFHTHRAAIITITVNGYRDVKFEVFITTVRSVLSIVPL